jgi:hypothetical protein
VCVCVCVCVCANSGVRAPDCQGDTPCTASDARTACNARRRGQHDAAVCLAPSHAVPGAPRRCDTTASRHAPAICTARSTNSATLSKSPARKPLLVSAGLPMRRPPGTMALTSPGTVFLLAARRSRAARHERSAWRHVLRRVQAGRQDRQQAAALPRNAVHAVRVLPRTCDVSELQHALSSAAVHALGAEVHQHYVVVRAAWGHGQRRTPATTGSFSARAAAVGAHKRQLHGHTRQGDAQARCPAARCACSWLLTPTPTHTHTCTRGALHAQPRTRHELVAAVRQAVCQRLAVLEHLLLVSLELGRGGLLQRARQPRDGVVVGAALQTCAPCAGGTAVQHAQRARSRVSARTPQNPWQGCQRAVVSRPTPPLSRGPHAHRTAAPHTTHPAVLGAPGKTAKLILSSMS